MAEEVIYLDYNASTPIDPRVAAVMRALLDGPFANPSAHACGRREARAILDRARAQVAALLGAPPDEIVFTSGGSEANNAALKGVFFARPRGRPHRHDDGRAPGDPGAAAGSSSVSAPG